jgi:hypothetical protein
MDTGIDKTVVTNKHQHGGNRRQPEGKLNSKGGTKHPQEDAREGSDAKKIPSSGTGVRIMTDKDSAPGMLMETMATQAIDASARKQEVVQLARTWPTPKESMTVNAGAQSSFGVTTGATTNAQMTDQTQPMNTKERRKKDKPSYPIFNWQASNRSVGAKNSQDANYSASNSSNSMTSGPVPNNSRIMGMSTSSGESTSNQKIAAMVPGQEANKGNGRPMISGAKNSPDAKLIPKSNNCTTMALPLMPMDSLAPKANNSMATGQGMGATDGSSDGNKSNVSRNGVDPDIGNNEVSGNKEELNLSSTTMVAVDDTSVHTNNSIAMAIGLTVADAVGDTKTEGKNASEGKTETEEKIASKPSHSEAAPTSKLTPSTPKINNSMAMVIGPKAVEAAERTSDKDGWNEVKPSKKRQKKLAFTNIPREPSEAASKSGPMEADPQGINSGTGKGNRPTKTATIVTPPY